MFGMGCLCMLVVLGGRGGIGEALGREIQEQENPLPRYGWVDEEDPERWRDSAIALWNSDEPGASRLVEDFIVAIGFMIATASAAEIDGEFLEETAERRCGGLRSIRQRLIHTWGLPQ